MSLERYDKAGKYIDFKINGRLFPSWINMNFKKLKLEDVFRHTNTDPCKKTTDKDNGELRGEMRKYQVFLTQFLDYRSPYHDVLVYHGLGSGKTSSAINVYNALYSYTPGWNVFILIKASLKGNWLDELKTWLRKDEYEYRYKNIIFIHYDSPFADRNFMDAIKNVDNSKKSLYIVDEVHNFIRNVYSNISSGAGKRAQAIYDYIIQDKKENPDTRVVLLSGTPAINNPYELALLFNLLRPGIFPKSENEFNHKFISSTTYQTLNINTKNTFQRRIMGLVSYYIGATPDLYASKTMHYVDVTMSDYQEDIYAYFEDIETKLALKAKGKGGSQSYKVYTRQACNFVFPAISQTVNGEARPRPGKFRLSEREATKLAEAGEVNDKDKGKLVHLTQYLKVMNDFIDTFKKHLTSKDNEDISAKHTIITDVKIFIEKYKGDYPKFLIEETKKSNLFGAMHISSPKMVHMIFNIMNSPGPTIVYSNYVLMEGLEIFKIYLGYFGFYAFMKEKKLQEGKIGYVEFHGGIKDMTDRELGKREFNKSENKFGQYIKIMLISPAGSEGISLKNVRQVHIMEPYWNEVRITQMIGRGLRQCSHADLPMDQRHIDVFRYKSIRKGKDKWSTDQYIEDVARSKDGLIQSFLDAVKEVAIDCSLFKPHNMMTQEYKCFQFDEPSLFDKHIGPAYRDDLGDDTKMDNGSNSMRSMTVKIKVMKINAVKQLTAINGTNDTESEEPIEYSKPGVYWMYPKTGVVYDFDLHFAIGKISMDENNILKKLDKDTYIIDYVIPIPSIID